MSKRKYEEPGIQVIYIQSADFITTSTDAFDGEEHVFGENNIPGENQQSHIIIEEAES